MNPLFTQTDYNNIELLNNLQYTHSDIPNLIEQSHNSYLTEIKSNTELTSFIQQFNKHKGKLNNYSPLAYAYICQLWITRIPTLTVRVILDKPDQFGNEIVRHKPVPTTLERFLTDTRISRHTFNKYLHAHNNQQAINPTTITNTNLTVKDILDIYEDNSKMILNFCMSELMQNSFVNSISVSPQIMKLMLINHAEYKDVSVVEHEISTKELPPFMRTNTNIIQSTDIEYESIDNQ